jgi:hypothetical protein
MPRDGSSIYHRPPGTDGIPNTTIASTPYNSYVADVEQDLNLPRPIVAGGTGASDAHTAMVNLSGEIAKQVVANYDSFPFVNGSFYSLPGATSAPTPGEGYAGIYYESAANNYATIEARNLTVDNGPRYVRSKVGGVWGAWKQQAGSTTDLDAAYVNVTGDTMTGDLTINKGSPQLVLNATPGSWAAISTYNNSKQRWLMRLGDGSAEGGSNAGNNFDINRYADDGSYLGSIFNINRASGIATFGADVVASGNLIVNNAGVTAGKGGTTGTYYFGNTGVKYLNYDGTNFNFAGGNIISQGSAFVSAIGATTGAYFFGNSGTKYLNYDGTNFNFVGGGLLVAGSISATSGGALTLSGYGGNANQAAVFFGNQGTHYLLFDGTNYSLPNGPLFCTAINGSTLALTGTITGATNISASGSIASGSMYMASGSNNVLQMMPTYYWQIAGAQGYLQWVGNSAVQFQSDYSGNFTVTTKGYQPGGGAWGATSDARIKNELGDYPRGLDDIAALRPIYYTYKGNDTDAAPAHIKQEDAENKLPLAVPYPNSNHVMVAQAETKFAGLIAQEVEAIWPEMVTKKDGYIDGQAVDDLRTLDTTPLIFALINACKELKARVEALEAA